MGSEDTHLPRVDPERIDSKDEARKAVEELREALRFHDHRYYVLNDPIIPDTQYDDLFRTLEGL